MFVSLTQGEDSPCPRMMWLSYKAEGTWRCVSLLTWKLQFPQGPSGGLRKLWGVKEVQLSPKVPSRDTEPGPLTIPHVLTPASRHALGQPLLTTVSLSWPGRNSKTIPLILQGKLRFRQKN